MGNKLNILIVFAFLVCFSSCKKAPQESTITQPDYANVEIPTFNADSAYHYVKTHAILDQEHL